MKPGTLTKEEKSAELKKYRDLLIAALDYWLLSEDMHIQPEDYNSRDHFNNLKRQTEEHFSKGRLTILKQWFRDLTERHLETQDFRFNKYLQDRTGYEIDIFKSYFDRIEKIVANGKITTDNQFYDVTIMVDQLCQTEPVDDNKMSILNELLSDYEQRKSRKIRAN